MRTGHAVQSSAGTMVAFTVSSSLKVPGREHARGERASGQWTYHRDGGVITNEEIASSYLQASARKVSPKGWPRGHVLARSYASSLAKSRYRITGRRSRRKVIILIWP
ncbi:hypothetical protein Acsp03_56630 [Actinomadura sp. NBRC 104412]|nr:hypothetical protein Acsp03_56630 [Actinomadura sp. NBRC 104412]